MLSGLQPLVVGLIQGVSHLLVYDSPKKQLFIIKGVESVFFNSYTKIPVTIFDQKKEEVDIGACNGFSLWAQNGVYFISCTRTNGRKKYVLIAESTTLDVFYVIRQHAISGVSSRVISYDSVIKNPLFFIENEEGISIFKSKTKRSIESIEHNVISPRKGRFDSGPISIISVSIVPEGILCLYDATIQKESHTSIQIGAALLSKGTPDYVIWRSDVPLFKKTIDVSEYGNISPIGLCDDEYGFHLFYSSDIWDVVSMYVDSPFITSHAESINKPALERSEQNPIIRPHTKTNWDSYGAFNPAIWDDGTSVHMLYRAIGPDGVSRLGYSSSIDGHQFGNRRMNPALELPNPRVKFQGYDPVMYPSGGSWGGIEDPRMVEIEGRIYVTATIFDGWDFIRVGVFSINTKDFMEKKFTKWTKPVFLSPAGQVNKNWVLFPEKVNGKFAVFHGLESGGRHSAAIEYLDTLDEEPGQKINSSDAFRHEIDDNAWDSMIRGAGPPPLKTKEGWLVFYHAIDNREPDRYKLGAMLLDLENPSHILYRSNHALLSPDACYENDGKPGVVYATGSIIRGDDVVVYYGGADAVTCCATINLKELLTKLVAGDSEFEFNKVYLY